VVDDVRFENEMRAVQKMRGVLWHVYRPDHAGSSIPGHRSEGSLADHYADMRGLINDSSILDLHLRAFDALKAEMNEATV
jgi:hypothetical protein